MAREKIRFLLDENGRKESVVLPVKEYQKLLEDIADLSLIAERRDEPAESLAELKGRLEEKWRNTGSR